MSKADKILDQIVKLQAELRQIQAKCRHPQGKVVDKVCWTSKGQKGCVDHVCGECELRWTTYFGAAKDDLRGPT